MSGAQELERAMEFRSEQPSVLHDPSRPPRPVTANAVGEVEVVAKAQRRKISEAYKLRVLEEIDAKPGQSGAILRREGLYSSQLSKWRQQRRDGELKALAPKKRGRKAQSAEARQVAQLNKRVAKLERELEKARVLIDAQKKLAEILGVTLPKMAETTDDE